MLYYLFEYLEQQFQTPGASVFQYLTFRAALAAIAALLLEKITKKSDFKMDSTSKRIPNFYNLSAGDALALAENCGLKVNLVGIGKIVNQSITKGALLKKGATITLKANL